MCVCVCSCVVFTFFAVCRMHFHACWNDCEMCLFMVLVPNNLYAHCCGCWCNCVSYWLFFCRLCMLCQLLFLFVLGTRPWRANPTEGNRHIKPHHEPPPPTTGSGTTNTTLNYTNLINKKVGGEPKNLRKHKQNKDLCRGRLRPFVCLQL